MKGFQKIRMRMSNKTKNLNKEDEGTNYSKQFTGIGKRRMKTKYL